MAAAEAAVQSRANIDARKDEARKTLLMSGTAKRRTSIYGEIPQLRRMSQQIIDAGGAEKAVHSAAMSELESIKHYCHLSPDQRSRDAVQRMVKMLSANAFFSLLPNKNVRALAREIRFTDLQKGEVLFEQGDPPGSFYIILRGAVNVVIDKDGRRVLDTTT